MYLIDDRSIEVAGERVHKSVLSSRSGKRQIDGLIEVEGIPEVIRLICRERIGRIRHQFRNGNRHLRRSELEGLSLGLNLSGRRRVGLSRLQEFSLLKFVDSFVWS